MSSAQSSSAAAAGSAARTYQDLRRPLVVKSEDDTTTYWDCSVEAWQEMVDVALDPASAKAARTNAVNKLREIDAAGRMCETAEGMAADEPCAQCEKAGRACMVYRGRKEAACAYCRRQGKGGCYAGDPSKGPAPSVEERLAAFEGQLESLVSRMDRVEERLAELAAGRQQDQTVVEEQFGALGSRIAAAGDGFAAVNHRFANLERKMFGVAAYQPSVEDE